MGLGGALLLLDAVTREAMLFAAAGLLIGGIDDLAVDFVYLARRAARWWRREPAGIATLDDLPPCEAGPLAVFVPAWEEAAVIGAMLSTLLARYGHGNYRVYVGCYPNDRATIAAAADVAARDPRVRLVIGGRAGPTTKADCLNTLWRAMRRDDAHDGRPTRAVIFHDAEDVVHAAELRVVDALIGEHDAVQLPVLPLVQPHARLVSGHYLDEFCESHGKTLVVRELIGAALPFAGVGCALSVPILEAIAARRGGEPFDAGSLVEDYELGLTVAQHGGRTAFVRIAESPGGAIVGTQAYFPDALHAAVVQKARWMVGIALAGWDRTGWSRWTHWGDHWMRMRDRRAPLAMVVLLAAYVALVGWAASGVAHWWMGTTAAPMSGWLALLLGINATLLVWRIAVRTAFTTAAHGWREARWAPLRMVVGNVIALLAARRALVRYCRMLGGARTVWDKTAHAFPDQLAPADR